MPNDGENHFLLSLFFSLFFLREEMVYDLRPRKHDKDYLSLVWYPLSRDVLLQVAEHAAEAAALPRFRSRFDRWQMAPARSRWQRLTVAAGRTEVYCRAHVLGAEPEATRAHHIRCASTLWLQTDASQAVCHRQRALRLCTFYRRTLLVAVIFADFFAVICHLATFLFLRDRIKCKAKQAQQHRLPTRWRIFTM